MKLIDIYRTEHGFQHAWLWRFLIVREVKGWSISYYPDYETPRWWYESPAARKFSAAVTMHLARAEQER